MSMPKSIRSLGLGKVSRRSATVALVAVVLAVIAALVGYNLYKKATTTTVVAYFPETTALYAGDRVQIMGVRVGRVDSVEPAGDKMKVVLHYDSQYKVPADATASILNPTVVASRVIQLSPPYTSGPVLADNDARAAERPARRSDRVVLEQPQRQGQADQHHVPRAVGRDRCTRRRPRRLLRCHQEPRVVRQRPAPER